jgi:hypothetical protein
MMRKRVGTSKNAYCRGFVAFMNIDSNIAQLPVRVAAWSLYRLIAFFIVLEAPSGTICKIRANVKDLEGDATRGKVSIMIRSQAQGAADFGARFVSRARGGGSTLTPVACTVLTRWFRGRFWKCCDQRGFLPRCRYVFPPESHFFPLILVVQCLFQAKNFDAGELFFTSKKFLLDAMNKFNDPSGGFSGPKRVFGLQCDESMCT